jgi:hypothetical protein
LDGVCVALPVAVAVLVRVPLGVPLVEGVSLDV